MKILFALSLCLISVFAVGQKKDSTHYSNRKTIFDFEKVLLIYMGDDNLVRYQVETKIAHKAAEYKIWCVPSMNLIPQGKDYSKINKDSFKLKLKEEGIEAAVVIDLAPSDEKYKKGKKKSKKQYNPNSPPQNGDFQFASFALDTSPKPSLYYKKVKAINVRLRLITLKKVIVEEIVEIKKPKNNEDAINKLTDWVAKRLSTIEKSKK